jgi:hypothetical protein
MHPDGEKRSRQDQSRLSKRENDLPPDRGTAESADAGCRGKEQLLRQQDNQGRFLKREEGCESADFAGKRDWRMYSV